MALILHLNIFSTPKYSVDECRFLFTEFAARRHIVRKFTETVNHLRCKIKRACISAIHDDDISFRRFDTLRERLSSPSARPTATSFNFSPKDLALGWLSQSAEFVSSVTMVESRPFYRLGYQALHHSEIEARLRDITVFSLLGHDQQFVVITGEQRKSLCPFFLTRDTADAFHHGLLAADLLKAKEAHTAAIGLDQYFKYLNSEYLYDENMKNISFRLVPNPKEVHNAVQLMKASADHCEKLRTKIEGVPIFQAQGLEIRPIAGANKAKPLFFSKEDVDAAVASADHTRAKYQRETLQKTVVQSKKNANTTTEKSERAPKPSTRDNKPTIIVGCLEWIIQQMGEDCSGAWTEVLFIPPGLIKSLHEDSYIPRTDDRPHGN